jgi:pyrroloquinoline-quinone synthase
MTSIDFFLDNIDSQIQSKHLLNHDFYKAWSKGELSIECLKEYAKEYYQHVKAFPTYLSAIHCRTEDANIRKVLLKNLIEEEAGSPNHPELWQNFAIALGVTEEELFAHKSSPEMEEVIATFRQICHQKNLTSGLSALYAYESQIPEICISKIAGLKEYYHLRNAKDWEYFSVHIAADQEHAAQERQLLKSTLNVHDFESINSTVNQVLDVLWNFLSGMCQRYKISSCSC